MERDEVFFEDRASFRSWLKQNCESSPGIWAVYYKQSSKRSDLSWDALVEECLCFGWIDSTPGKVDDEKTKHYVSPRKKDSGWSRRNKFKLIELEKLGLISDAGNSAITRAKSNGSWERFDLAEALVLPAELEAKLSNSKQLNSGWLKLSESQRRQKLQFIYDAKTDSTRNKRIEDLVSSLS